MSHVERQRQTVQPRILRAIDRAERGGVLKAMQASVRSVLGEAGDAEFVASEYALCQAGKSVRKRLKKLFDESPGLADPEQHEQHHAMRIAAKRLRYTLELAKPVYSSDLASTGNAVKKLQTLLGEIHDCDVWVEKFKEFAHKESSEIRVYFGSSQRFERLRHGLDYLRQERKDRRCQVFGELVTFWQELKDQGLWDRLATILEWGGTRAKSQETLKDSSAANVAPQA